MRRIWVTASVLLLLAMPAGAMDAATVLATPRQRIQSTDFRVTGHLVRVEPSGARTSYSLTIKAHWFPGVLRVLVDIGSPAAGERVHILLEMRPDGRNAIEVAHPGDKAPAALPFGKWQDGPIGSGFSYEDFLEPQYFWPGQTVASGTKFGARICDLLKSTPGPADRTHYAEIRTWLDHTISFPVYIEKSLKDSTGVKEFTYFGLRQDGGVWSASQVEEKTRGKAGSTLLIIDHGSAKAKLVLGDFGPEQLTRF